MGWREWTLTGGDPSESGKGQMTASGSLMQAATLAVTFLAQGQSYPPTFADFLPSPTTLSLLTILSSIADSALTLPLCPCPGLLTHHRKHLR